MTDRATSATGLKEFLVKLSKNYQILRKREAKYAAAAPLDLLNQLDDYEQAINLTKQAVAENIPLDTLQTEFSGLNLQIDTVVFVSQEPPRKPFTGQNPYRGLHKFTEADAGLFFGRNEAIQSLLDTVQLLVEKETSQQNPDLVAVLGPLWQRKILIGTSRIDSRLASRSHSQQPELAGKGYAPRRFAALMLWRSNLSAWWSVVCRRSEPSWIAAPR